ncbi:Oidioi.mRNA.OKI2018_I69.PAR.g11858.t1.cds [Oikopleura dioica]|uniref:Oidioi.mRNA.OKI2018_I69.PAR.g11858.t1.cds n=1 Tax=Oikopleura dioica TaxID=34765 RepID=A0ABN7S0N5_OIKDI|nr:Oidioi.mRNA.OKI2018_I69.PAR.g11858.t1.cds [Oikopleura dioica]
MAYSVLENLLAQVNRHATILGKYWFVALYTCRIVIVCSIASAIYSDEQSSFKCNTLQVGCENVCFNQISPISQIRFWAVQIIFTCAPTVIFVLWAVNAVHCMMNLVREIIQDRAVQNALDSRSADGSASELSLKLVDYQNYTLKTKMIRQEVQNISAELPSILLMYILQLLLRIAMECFFAFVQFKIYGTQIKNSYLCNRSPCRVVTQCFMSRPKEKTIISWIMFGLTVWSRVVNYHLFIVMVLMVT